MKARKKPVVVEVLPVSKFLHTPLRDLPKEFKEAFISGKIKVNALGNGDYTLSIDTLEGVMTASSNDMLIAGVKGEIYPCKFDIFVETYEVLPDNDEPDSPLAINRP